MCIQAFWYIKRTICFVILLTIYRNLNALSFIIRILSFYFKFTLQFELLFDKIKNLTNKTRFKTWIV